MNILPGIKVVELCEMVAGPYCAKLLADMGADVIKVEPPFVGDGARRVGPFLNDQPDQDGSILFSYVNTSKRSVTLDVRHPQGNQILQRLIAQADLFIEDNAPAVARDLGLSFDALRGTNPKLVTVSITPFGQTGPYKDFKAYPLNTFHSGGEGYITPGGTQFLDRPPLKQGRYVGEYEAALVAAVPALAALFYAGATGLGQHVDVSKQEALIGLNAAELEFFLGGGKVLRRETRGYKIGGILPCKDGYVQTSLHEEHQWQGLIKLIGSPAWAEDEWFKNPVTRDECADAVNDLLIAALSQLTKGEIYHRGQQLGCTIGPYYDVREVVSSDQMKARDFFVELEHPKAGKVRCPTAAYRFAGLSNSIKPAPTLGQHNREVYAGMLGYSAEDLICLREQRVI